MANKNAILISSSLLTILLLLLLIIPKSGCGQIKTLLPNEKLQDENSSSSVWEPANNVSEHVTEKYLALFGCKSPHVVQHEITFESEASGINIRNNSESSVYLNLNNGSLLRVNVDSTFNTFIEKTNGYTYDSHFSFGDSREYSVTESEFTKTIGNQVITTSEQNITGSMNYFMSSIEKKTIKTEVTKQNYANIRLINTSGSYYININGSSIWNLNESTMLSGNAKIEQNLIEPIGKYSVQFIPERDGQGIKAMVTLPNGTIIDPGIEQFADDFRYCGGNPPYLYYYHLFGWYVWWTATEAVWAALIVNILDWTFTEFLEPMNIVFTVIEYTLAEAVFYLASDGIYRMYFEYVALECWFWNGLDWGLSSHVPQYAEIGFFTDVVYVEYYGWYYLGDWYYICCFPSSYAHNERWPPGFEQQSQNFVLSEISHWEWYGSAATVEYPYNLLGWPDGQYAHLHAGNPGDYATIVGYIGTFGAVGEIAIYGHSGTGYYSDLYVYVSNDGQNWNLANTNGQPITVTATSSYWIDIGWVPNSFRYIAVTAYDGRGYSVCLYLDSVVVMC